MRSEIMHQIVETIEAEVRSRPSPLEFEMAYQVRVAMDRIKFAIKHAEQFSKPCIHMRDASHPEREFIEWVDPRIGRQRNAELCQAHAFGISLDESSSGPKTE